MHSYPHTPDPRVGQVGLDAMILDARGGPDGERVEELINLSESGQILLFLPGSVRDEIAAPETPALTRERANRLIYSVPVNLTAPEIAARSKIAELIRGNAKPAKHAADAMHIAEAAKYGRFFLTQDGRLLKKRLQITRFYGGCLFIFTPEEFLTAFHTSQNEVPPIA